LGSELGAWRPSVGIGFTDVSDAAACLLDFPERAQDIQDIVCTPLDILVVHLDITVLVDLEQFLCDEHAGGAVVQLDDLKDFVGEEYELLR